MHSRKSTMVLIATLVALVAALAGSARAAGNERLLYVFNGYDGSGPEQDLTFDAQGNLYGTTVAGGETNMGTVFKLTPGPNGTWSETVLHTFQNNGKDGSTPKGGVIVDKAGNLYGTTSMPGGAVFELTPGPDGTWSETVLHTFGQSLGVDGSFPNGDLIMDKAGNIYGTTNAGGGYRPGYGSGGTVFELARASNGPWSYATVFSFNNKGGGSYPNAGLAMDAAGNLYGTTIGTNYDTGKEVGGDGIVFKLTRGSDGEWTETVLHTFHNPNLRDSWGRLIMGPGRVRP